MPCEGCNVQFTVFKRKRICTDCRRYYCSHCLTSRNASILCERCAIFAKRPLLKIDLLQLKPKDLIFYLQSKHISTTGCVEKEELVRLVLTHVNQNDAPNIGSPNGNKFSDFNGADKPFDNIKQTCQNFFNNLTDKISSDFNFDSKTSATTTANNASATTTATAATGTSANITDQPRISTREIPTYSSFQNQPPSVQSPSQPAQNSNSSSPTSPVSSPVVSMSSISSQSTASRSPHPAAADGQSTSRSDQSKERPMARNLSSARNRLLETVLNDEGIASECECSDDELITTFKDRSNRDGVGGGTSTSPTNSSPIDNQIAGPSVSGSGSVNGLAPKSSPSLQIGSYEESSESSFEELGAIGGISDDNKTESLVQNENWQFVNKTESNALTVNDKKTPLTLEEEGSGTTSAGNSTDLALVSSESSSGPSRAAHIFASKPKRVTRRRSDGYLNRRRYAGEQGLSINKELSVEEEENDDDDGDDDDDEEEGDDLLERRSNWKRERKCCGKCGKNKTNIKHHVMKLRRHLESANMSEAEIKQELEEFLVYLENRTRSTGCGDLVDVGSATSPYLDENDGIHVYAHADGGYDPKAAASRFLNLNDFDSLEELDNLTVKQLKQILTLNRVDYKGCCEKQELLERVTRLWKNLKSCPAIEKLPTDELCKICMDAPIECVILECGHMATCTNCGKVLSECPICRQYIVRVVRFFRA